jgi:hypothetical protein
MSVIYRTIIVLFTLYAVAAIALAHGHDHHDHGHGHHHHGTIEADRPMSVTLEVVRDPMGKGYNVLIFPVNFHWTPLRASTAHVPGEGHGHLYINDGETYFRIYGNYFHLRDEWLREGENTIRVTLNANTHDEYTVDGVLVSDTVTIVHPMSATHDHGHTHHDHHHHDHAGANRVMLGEMALTIEPLLVADGTLKLALTVTEHAHHDHEHDKAVTVTLPDGETIDATFDGELAFVELGAVQAGVYRLSGTLGHDALDTGFTVMRAEGDLGTEVTAVLAPTPDHHSGEVEVFIYAFEDGAAVHRAMTLALEQGESSMSYPLSHTHFSDAYIRDDFEPMAEQTSVQFAAAGEWAMTLTISGPLPETATFTVMVE